MGQKNLFEPDQIGEQRLRRRRLPSQPSSALPGQRDLWPFLVFIFLLTLIALLIWTGQVWH